MADAALIARLVAALSSAEGVTAAYLFGSAATGREHRQSDVDIAVRLDPGRYPTGAARFEARLGLIGALQRAAGREVDLVILNEAPPHLAREIMTAGTRLLVADADEEFAHLRLTLSRAADLAPFLRRARAVKLRAVAP